MKDEFNEGEDVWVVSDTSDWIEVYKELYEDFYHGKIRNEVYPSQYIFNTELGAVNKMLELRKEELKGVQEYVEVLKLRQKELKGES